MLGQRLAGGEPKDLASQLPPELQESLTEGAERGAAAHAGTSFGEQELISHIATALDTSEQSARADATAVLTTVAEAVTGGQLNHVLSQLPSGYAPLFGHTDLT